VACIPDVVKRPGVLGDTGILVVFMFPGSFVVHPICRSLLRHSPSRLAFGLKMSAWSLIVGTVGAGAAELVSLNFDKFDWPDLAADASLSISNFTTLAQSSRSKASCQDVRVFLNGEENDLCLAVLRKLPGNLDAIHFWHGGRGRGHSE